MIKRFVRKLAGAGLVAAAALAVAAPAEAACRLVMIGPAIPVSFTHHRVIVPVEIDGHRLRALVASGAFHTTLSRAAAIRLGLRLDTVTSYLRAIGVGGEQQLQAATVTVQLAGATWPRKRLIVVGGELDVDVILGQDFLSQADVEYDLAHGVIRIMRADGCADADMPYWATRYDEAPLIADSAEGSAVVPVKLNGHTARAELDTGSFATVVTTAAAAAAGAKVDPRPTQETARGIGPSDVPLRPALFTTVQIGGEVIPNAVLRTGDLFGRARTGETGSLLAVHDDVYIDMLLGADFFASHRVLVSPSHHKVFFSYNDGEVFPPPAGWARPVAADGRRTVDGGHLKG